jgi:hypothetical protein
MPKFVIERELPGAGKLSAGELQAVAKESCDILRIMGLRFNGCTVMLQVTGFTASKLRPMRS